MSKIFCLIIASCLAGYSCCSYPKKLNEEDVSEYFRNIDQADLGSFSYDINADDNICTFSNKNSVAILPAATMSPLKHSNYVSGTPVENSLYTTIIDYFSNFKKFDLKCLSDKEFTNYYRVPGKYLIIEDNGYKCSVPVHIADIIFDEDITLSKQSIEEVMNSFFHEKDKTLSIKSASEIHKLPIDEETLYIVPNTYGVLSVFFRDFDHDRILVKRMLIPNVSSLERIIKHLGYALQKVPAKNCYQCSNYNSNISLVDIVLACITNF